MKKLTLILSLIFTVTLSSPSYAKWTKVSENVNGHKLYVNFETIRKHGEYVYYWDFMNYEKPSPSGSFSSKSYHQVDCNLLRYKMLTNIMYKQRMGQGNGESYSPKNPEWNYSPPNSLIESILKAVCKH